MGCRAFVTAICAGIFLLCASNAAAVVVVTVSNGVVVNAVTKMTMGAGLVYSWEADALYADGEMAQIIKDIGIGTLRWPGGAVVAASHWNALTGNGWTDSWNPAYSHTNDQPAGNFMDLDEYLALIDKTGAEIMLGVNMSSGKEWNREADGIEDARMLVQTCKDRGYDVKYIYFDNENYHPDNNYNKDVDGDGEAWTAASYAASFNLYAAAVKQVFPSAKLIANWNNNVTAAAFRTDMQTMLSIAGTNIDYVDIHFYWEWGSASWALWKSEQPMLRADTAYSYESSVRYANDLFVTLGYPHIKMAVMEWNLGPGPWTGDVTHTKFKTALMQTEMQMQFLRAGLDIGLLYALNSPAVPANRDHHVTHSGDPNATALWMWLFSKAIGKTVVQSASSLQGIYIVSAKGSRGELVIYLLNKTDIDQTVELNIPGYVAGEVSEAWRFCDGGSGAGALQKITLWDAAGKKRTTLLANSLNMIGLNYPAATDSDRDGISDAWETAQFGSIEVANAVSDFDGDGSSDHSEYLAGTVPGDSQSSLRFHQVQREGSAVKFGWRGLTGREYFIESTTNLISGRWSAGTTYIGVPGDNLLSAELPNSNALFYRLRAGSVDVLSPVSPELLIAWDGGINTNSAVHVAGISGNALTGNIYNQKVDPLAGSTDGSFGYSFSGAGTGLSAYPVRTNTPGNTDTMGFQIINNTGVNLHLNSIIFDYAAWWATSPMSVRIIYASGDLDVTAGTVITTVVVSSGLGSKTGDYEDFEVSLTGLPDDVLAPGQSATFYLIAGDAAGATANGAFDNAGFTGWLEP